MGSSRTFDVNGYIASVEDLFLKHGNETAAAGAKAYMRDQFEFIGLTTPKRRLLQKKFFAQHLSPPIDVVPQIVAKLWKKREREFQYFGLDLYEKYRKQISEKDTPSFELMITNKSWWDTVDFVAPKLIAALHLNYPELQEPNCARWMKSGNMWLMRAAIIHQNLYKKKTNEILLYKLITRCMDHEDFFIRKAIGWSLRQYARTNPQSVRKFVTLHSTKLHPLSTREAMKHL